MNELSKRTLYWMPRALSIAFIAFVSLFALDAFDEGLGFRGTLLALAMHLIPAFVLIAGLVLAWRWEWIGAALYAAAGALYVIWVSVVNRPVSSTQRLSWAFLIAGPAFAVAALFLANWLKHGELHEHGKLHTGHP